MKIFMILLMSSASLALAAEHEHRHHGAHQHGSGTLAIAFEGKTGKAEFKVPADTIVGFEHLAKSPKDKEKLAKSISEFEKNISQRIQFDSKLNCLFKKEKIDMVREKDEGHSEFYASFSIQCEISLTGSSISFDFTSFDKMKDLDVTLLVDTLQKSLEIKSEKMRVDLK